MRPRAAPNPCQQKYRCVISNAPYNKLDKSLYFCRAMLRKRGLCRRAVSVCLSATFVHSVETNERIFEFFSASGSHAISFSTPNVREIFLRGPPPQRGANTDGVGTNRDSRRIAGYRSTTTNNCDHPPCSLPHTSPRISESMFITTSMDDHDEEKRTEQNLFVRSGKSEA